MRADGQPPDGVAGMGERALELMSERALSRTVFRRRMAEHGGFQQQLARSRVNLDSARLTVLDAAHALDRLGNKQVSLLSCVIMTLLLSLAGVLLHPLRLSKAAGKIHGPPQ